MKSMLSELKKVLKSETIAELTENTSSEILSVILFFPMLLIIITPLRQFVEDTISPLSQKSTYPLNILTVNLLAVIALIIYYSLYILKNKHTIDLSLKASIKNPVFLFFSILIIQMILSTLFNGLSHEAIYGDPYRNESLFTFILYFAYYFTASSLIKFQKCKAFILYANLAVSTFIAIMVLIDRLIVAIPAFHYPDEITCQMVTAVFNNSNHYAYYLVISIISAEMLFIKEKNIKLKTFCLLSFIIQEAVLIINDTFGGYLACSIALVFSTVILCIVENRINKLSVTIIIIFIAITLIMNIWYDTVFNSIMNLISDVKNIAENSEKAKEAGSHRWALWQNTVRYICEKPVLGFGVEGIGERLNNEAGNDRPHNEFLQYAAFFGIPAVLSYICGVFSVFLYGLKNKYKIDIYSLTALSAAFGYLISSLFGNTMYYTAPYFFIMLGIGFNIETKEKIK